MSRFGDDNLHADIYENLKLEVSENKSEQLEFLHNMINGVAENGLERLNDNSLFMFRSVFEKGLTKREVLEALGDVYASIAVDLADDDS